MKNEKNVLFVLAASAVMILLVTVITLSKGSAEKQKGGGSKAPTPTSAPITPTPILENPEFAMIQSVDPEKGTITLYRLEEGGELTLTYQTAADIRDKYGSLTYAAALSFGDIVEVQYDASLVLLKLQKSSKYWEYRGIEDFSVSDSKLTVNGVTYKLSERTVCYCDGERIDLGEVKDIDRINICGNGQEVYTIHVVKGHGSIQLINGEKFEGAKVTFGSESHELTGEPVWLVREGSYKVVVNGEKEAAVVEVTVARNERVVIDLYEYGGAPVETSTVMFHITPFSSILLVDGETVDYYEKELTLPYGEHKVEVSLGGYRSYVGYITLSKAYQSFQFALVENTAGNGEDPNGGDIIDGGEDQNGGDGGDNGDGSSDGNDGSTDSGDGSSDSGDGGSDGGDTGTDGDTSGKVPGGESGEIIADGQIRKIIWLADALVETMNFRSDSKHITCILAPKGAEIKVEGISIGEAPVQFGKILGSYTVTVTLDGKSQDITVTVEDDDKDVYWNFPDPE